MIQKAYRLRRFKSDRSEILHTPAEYAVFVSKILEFGDLKTAEFPEFQNLGVQSPVAVVTQFVQHFV